MRKSTLDRQRILEEKSRQRRWCRRGSLRRLGAGPVVARDPRHAQDRRDQCRKCRDHSCTNTQVGRAQPAAPGGTRGLRVVRRCARRLTVGAARRAHCRVLQHWSTPQPSHRGLCKRPSTSSSPDVARARALSSLRPLRLAASTRGPSSGRRIPRTSRSPRNVSPVFAVPAIAPDPPAGVVRPWRSPCQSLSSGFPLIAHSPETTPLA